MARKKKEEPIIEEIKVEATPIVEEKPKRKKTTYTAKVNRPALNVRPDPSIENTPVTVLHEGDKVKVVKDLGEWSQIEEGYVMSKYIDK